MQRPGLQQPASVLRQELQCSTSYAGAGIDLNALGACGSSRQQRRASVACSASASTATVTKTKTKKAGSAAKGANGKSNGKAAGKAIGEIPRGETAGATLVVDSVTIQAGDRDLLTVRHTLRRCAQHAHS